MNEHGGQMRNVRSRKHTAGDVDHLEIFCSGEGGDVSIIEPKIER